MGPITLTQTLQRTLAVSGLLACLGACSSAPASPEEPIVDEQAFGASAFGEPQPDPFAIDDSDPFAVSDSDPFAIDDSDPFGAPTPVEPVVDASSDFGDATSERRQALVNAIEEARDGNIAQARADLRALQSDPEFGPWATYNLGVIATAENQLDQARRYFEDALSQNPALGDALAAIVRPMIRDGEIASAQSLVQRYMAASGNAPQIEAVGLYLALEAGQYEEVIQRGRTVLLQQPDNLDTHYSMAMAYVGLGQEDLGRYILNQALTRDPERSDIRYGLATIELAAGNTVSARSMLRQVVDRNPYHAESWNNLGVLYMGSRNFTGALEAFENATTYASGFKEAWMNLGNARKALSDYPGSRSAYERAIALDPRYSDPWFNLGVLVLDTDLPSMDRIARYEESISHFREFQNRAGTLPPDHAVFEYIAEAEAGIERERALAAPPEPEPERRRGGDGGFGDDDGFGDDGFGDDGFGDDGFGDDGFGDDGFGDDGFGDDGFGDDGFGDDGFGDDGFGDDGFGDDGFGDDGFGDDGFGDDEDDSEDAEDDDGFGDDGFGDDGFDDFDDFGDEDF